MMGKGWRLKRILAKGKISLLILGVVLLDGLAVPQSMCGEQSRQHEVYFPNTPYELHTYRIHGREPGTTLLIIGGIQGDEPGGFLAADRYVDLSLRRGDLILIPRANLYSIIKNLRGPDGDMNRRFRDVAPRDYVDRIVAIIKGLMPEADCLLNLHDGSGFYSPRWEGPQRNPKRCGQSIIADAAVYLDPKKGRSLTLKDLARRVIRKVNPGIHNQDHHFRFNNHRTMREDTLHPEQRTSATYYALTRFGIPAFGVETSKDIADRGLRVEYQTMVINAFMEELGIVTDHPPMVFDAPELRYLVVRVNGGMPVAVSDREALHLAPGDAIQILEVVANYQRGITVDIQGLGTENDFQKVVPVRGDTRVLVRKESEVFGQIDLRVTRAAERDARAVQSPNGRRGLRYFVLDVHGEKRVVENHGRLHAILGDHLRIVDVVTEGVAPGAVKVNFIGFVGDEKGNDGEDRGYLIRTASDLWPRYALDKKGTQYRIVSLLGKSLLGEMVLALDPPVLSYIVVRRPKTPPACYMEGTHLAAVPGEEIQILDIKTNVPKNLGVCLVVKGGAVSVERRGEGWVLRVHDGASSWGELVVSRCGIPMGRLWIQGL
jgi:hypothetical protein